MFLGPSADHPFGHQHLQSVQEPVGTVISYAGPVDEKTRGVLKLQGWLFCDGDEVAQVAYPLLFQAIGGAYGDASAHFFRLPDYRGVFLRGVNGDRQPPEDPDADHRTGSGPGDSGNTGNQVGSIQKSQFQEHEHEITTGKVPILPGDKAPAVQVVTQVVTPSNSVVCNQGTPGSTECFGPETRPVNAYVNFLIKAAPRRGVLRIPSNSFGLAESRR